MNTLITNKLLKEQSEANSMIQTLHASLLTQTNIINELKSISNELIFVSMSKTETTTNINLDIRPKEFDEIIKITGAIKEKFKKSKTIVARNSNLNL